jgi:hypothetical protein
MSHFYAIGVPRDGSYEFDIAAFRARLVARWPEAVLEVDTVTKSLTFFLPTIPLHAALDETSPGGLSWWVALIGVRDEQGGGRRWRVASEVPGHEARYAMSPDRNSLWVEGTILDCVVFALWLRGWLPPEVPLTVSDNGYTNTAVAPGMSILDLVRRIHIDMREHDRAERAWAEANMEPVPGGWRAADGSIYYSAEGPPGQERRPEAENLAMRGLPTLPPVHMDDPTLAAVIREHLHRLLGDEAEQFFAPDDNRPTG